MTDRAALNAELIAAHRVNDTATLVRIYHAEGRAALATDDTYSGCFLLTHAYIYALESGAPEAQEIHKILKSYGREE